MKTKIYILAGLLSLTSLTSCSDWLDLKPNNEQVTDDYWKSKEDVEAVIASGYYYMREWVPTLIKWGELRGGTFYATGSTDAKLQNFNIIPTDALCDYTKIYQIINMANSVIHYAPNVRSIDNTYYEARLNAHLCEAYFQRAYAYLVLLKNYSSVPLITFPYVDDNESFDIAKSTPQQIAEQIKLDIKAALATGAAKGAYETEWQTKGRATKWALYALMADVCLWSEDYAQCVEYCNYIINATDAFRPAFLKNTYDWYSIYYPGNSNESIFELYWDYNTENKENNFSSLFGKSAQGEIRFTEPAMQKLRSETDELITANNGIMPEGRVGRMIFGTYIPASGNPAGYASEQTFYFWKYNGTDVADAAGGARVRYDANFILYRMAEIFLIKAQAETMLGNYRSAVEQINTIRNRAGLSNFNGIDLSSPDADAYISTLDEQSLLVEIIEQKNMELMGEGKRWYDLLWLGSIKDYKYKDLFIGEVISGNQTTNKQWILSVLNDPNAWYMPIPQSDIDHNRLLEQNPYYTTTN